MSKINPASAPSYTPTNFPFVNIINVQVEIPRGDPIGSPSVIPNEEASVNPRDQPSSYPDFIKR